MAWQFVRSLILAIVVLNGLDLLFTVVWLKTERATEGNPIMAPAFDQGFWAALGLKATLVGLGLVVISRLYWRSRLAHWALVLGAVVYGIVVLYHVVGGLM